MPRSQIVYEEMYEAEYEAYRNEQKRLQGEQLDIFGEVA